MAEGNYPGKKPEDESKNCEEARDADTDSAYHSYASGSVSFMSTSSTTRWSDVTTMSRSPSMFSIQSSNLGPNNDDTQSRRSDFHLMDNASSSDHYVLRLNNEPYPSTTMNLTTDSTSASSYLPLMKDYNEDFSSYTPMSTYDRPDYSTGYTAPEDMFTSNLSTYAIYERDMERHRQSQRSGMYWM